MAFLQQSNSKNHFIRKRTQSETRVDCQPHMFVSFDAVSHSRPDPANCDCSVSRLFTYHLLIFMQTPYCVILINLIHLDLGTNSGDADGRVPVIGTRYCIEALALPLNSPWHSWYHNHQVRFAHFFFFFFHTTLFFVT